MADSLLTIGFDPASMAEIARLFEFEAILTVEMAVALDEAGQIVTEAARANTWSAFQNPTGQLASSLAAVPISPWEVGVQAGVPYAFRREFGFSGMTDSLGRFYPDDPAEPYAQPALDDNADKVMALMEEAVARTWVRIGGA